MLSFELSAVDIILMIAVIVLLILYITKLSTKTAIEEKPMTITTSLKTEGEMQSPMHTPKNSVECHHYLGYLKKFGKNAVIPNECSGCPIMMECFSTDE